MTKKVLKAKEVAANRIAKLSESSYDYIPEFLLTNDHFANPNDIVKSKFLNFSCKKSVSLSKITKVFIEYEIYRTFPRRNSEHDNEKNGIAFLYRSPDKKLRGIKEASYGFDYPYHILAEREYTWADKLIDGTNKDCYTNEMSRLEKKLMQETTFTPLPCPFGLHLVSKKPTSIIRVFDNNISALKVAIFDPNSICISADEEQLSGELAKEALDGRTVIYYPRYNKWDAAHSMMIRLREQGVNIAISPLINSVTMKMRFEDYDLNDYIDIRLIEQWGKSQILEEIQEYDNCLIQ